ncbi:hypothetical protein [Pseudalkalibacillus decolorationis]|uniref:hypothetical protein n=1 Tax=Pseudalkalibacillus decolorationis TaxID=163879 RepID=UPI00214853D0|nr:hypothetical protein [Pseudalkalibacillus decolorationis]
MVLPTVGELPYFVEVGYSFPIRFHSELENQLVTLTKSVLEGICVDVQGNFDIDKTESIDVKYFNLDYLPEGLTEEYRGYIEPYIKELVKI